MNILKKIIENLLANLRLLLPGKDAVSRWSFGMAVFSMLTFTLTVVILFFISNALLKLYYIESYEHEVSKVSHVCKDVIRQTREADANASDSILFCNMYDSLQHASIDAGFFCILDSQRTVVYSRQHPELKGSDMFVNVRDSTHLEAYIATASSTESNLWNLKFMQTIELDDTSYLVSLARLGGTPWFVATVSGDNVDDGLSAIARIIIIISFTSLVLCLVGNIVMFYFMRRSERKRSIVQTEIESAASLQQKMVPKTFPVHELFQLHGMLKPAKDMGGDLYDFIIKDGRLIFCVGDVSGKGMPAALIMSTVHSSFRAALRRSLQPEEIVSYINEAVAADNETMMFCTFWAGVYTPETGELTFCNAGHNAPVLIDTDGKSQFMKIAANMPLGVIEDFPYQQQSMMLEPGAALLVYTDGVTEAMNINHEEFGDDTLLASTDFSTVSDKQAADKWDAKSIVGRVYRDVRHHARHEAQSDDITMLCLKR